MVKSLKIVLSAVLLLSFFLPWFSADLIFTQANLSGYNLVELLTSEFFMMVDSEASIYYTLYLIPVFALISLIMPSSRVWSLIAGIFTLFICIMTLNVANEEGLPLFDFLAIGGYLTFLTSILLIITSFVKVEKKQRGTS